MPAARALGVIRVDRPAAERADRVLDEARLVERVRVDRDLDVALLRHREAGLDGRAVDLDNDALFTWWPPWRNMRARNIGWRIDYVLASEALTARAATCLVERDVGTSDHAPVRATFQID